MDSRVYLLLTLAGYAVGAFHALLYAVCRRSVLTTVRLFEVENVPYDRLEVSSPGLDRVLRGERDFVRYAGEQVRVRVRVPVNGQRNFTGRLGGVADGALDLEVEGATVGLDLANLEKVRLVPNICVGERDESRNPFAGRRAGAREERREGGGDQRPRAGAGLGYQETLHRRCRRAG